jgi:hypothetical protein
MTRVLVCRVGCKPEVTDLEGDRTRGHYDGLRKVVGGMLTCVGLDDGVDVWCHDEGILLGLPLNRRIPTIAPEVPEGFEIIPLGDIEEMAEPGQPGEWRIHGDFVMARCSKSGNMTAVTEDDIAKYMKEFEEEDPVTEMVMAGMKALLDS